MPKTQQHDPFAALRFRNYCLYLIARVLSFMSYQMQSVAIGWELYERTHSAMVLGGVGLVQIVPIVVMTLLSGHVADRFNRQRTVTIVQVMLALCSLGLAVFSYTQAAIWLIYACLFCNGIARAFYKPANDALFPQLVPVPVFHNAVMWNTSAFQFASVVGPALGGIAIAWHRSAMGVYILCALLSFTSAISIAAISHQESVKLAQPPSLKNLLAGANFIWENQTILATITLDLFAVLLGGATTLLPIFAKDILHVGPSGLGFLRAAPAMGALLMAIALVYLPPMQKAGRALLWSVTGFGIVTIVFGLSRLFWLSLLMLALSGALDSISMIIRQTFIQMRTPDYLRGRVSAINSIFIGTSNELGGFESGFTAAIFGPVASVVGGGIGTIAIVIAVVLLWPSIRKIGSLQEG